MTPATNFTLNNLKSQGLEPIVVSAATIGDLFFNQDAAGIAKYLNGLGLKSENQELQYTLPSLTHKQNVSE